MYACMSGEIVERFPDQYLALWPGAIETIPLLHYTPGGRYLLISTIGCNLSCEGCVSHVLVKNQDLLTNALIHAPPSEILRRVRENACIGAIFYLNEPTVSIGTVTRVAQELHAAGFTIGCASNGCMSQDTLGTLLLHLDFITIGLKGISDEAYRKNGAPCTADQVFENLKYIHSRQIHLEVATVCKTENMEDTISIAKRISAIYSDIPLHLMRFIPFDGASEGSEPSARAAEDLIAECRKYLPWVYLFNTPSTRYLNTYCPDCGELLIERKFNGPMGARLTGLCEHTCPSCGVSIPIIGQRYTEYHPEPRFRGGYRTPVALDMVYTILKTVGISDENTIGYALTQLLSGDNLEQLQTRLGTPDGYIGFLELLREWTEDSSFNPLIKLLSDRVHSIRHLSISCRKPRVLSVLSHPLLPSYPDKMENALISLAGGEVLNYSLGYDEISSGGFSREAFLNLKPDVIVVTGPGHLTIDDFKDFCSQENLTAPAIDLNHIFMTSQGNARPGPSWVLTLELLANYLHPEVFNFQIDEEENALLLTLPGYKK